MIYCGTNKLKVNILQIKFIVQIKKVKKYNHSLYKETIHHLLIYKIILLIFKIILIVIKIHKFNKNLQKIKKQI